MCAGDGDTGSALHEAAEHLGVFDDVEVAFACGFDFGVVFGDGGGDDEHVGVVGDGVGGLFEGDVDAIVDEFADDFGVDGVGAGAVCVFAFDDACETAHAAAADADEVDIFIGEFEAVEVVGEGAFDGGESFLSGFGHGLLPCGG